MVFEKFVTKLTLIEKVFDKQFVGENLELWYEELGQLEEKEIEFIVKELCKTCKYMPKLPEAIELKNNMGFKRQQQQFVQVDCEKCKGEGYILYTRIIEQIPYQYFAKCTCRNGERHSYYGRDVQDKRYRSDYFVESIDEIGKDIHYKCS